MALTNTPAWPQTPRYSVASVASANTATDGSGTITSLITAGNDGMRLSGLYAGANATVTATAVRLFLSTDSGSTWTYLPHLDSVIPAHTLEATTANAGWIAIIDQFEAAQYLDLPANAQLGFTIAVAISGLVIVEATGADD